MPHTIQNAATGEEITFLLGAAETGGAYTESIVKLPPNGEGPPLHVHPYQEEYFEALEGSLGLTVGERKIILQPGQSFTVPAGVPHNCFAVRGATVRCRAIWKPSLHIEYLLSEIFSSANRRKSKSPSAFDAAFVLHQLRGEYFLAGKIPAWLQRTLFALFAFLGKTFGLVRSAKIN